MYDSDIAEFLPKLGGRGKQEKRVPFKRAILKSFSGRNNGNAGFSKTGGHPRRGPKARHTKAPALFAQRCVVKARVVKLHDNDGNLKKEAKKSTDLHLSYISREGVEKDGSKGKLYGPEEELDKKQFAREIKKEPHQFRFIVSPENAHELDLTDFTKKLMKQMESDLDRELEWAAVNHYNTDNPHVHIVVRGLDRDGKEVRMDREYISNGIRNRAIEIITNELGYRNEHDLEKQIERDIVAERLTGLDFQIEKIAEQSPDKLTVALDDYPDSVYERIKQLRLTSRLETLQSLGLAANTEYRTWQLKDGWKDTLKELGIRNDILKTMHREIDGDPAKYNIVNDRSAPINIEGRLSKKGLANELYDKYYLIVESPTGESYYVNAHKGINLDELKEGGFVKLKVAKDSWLKPSDKNIDKVASINQGVYSPELHLRSIGTDKIKVRNTKTIGKENEYIEIKSEDFVKSHERRLYKLRNYGLAEQLENGAWKISENLIPELTQRDLERPINSVRVNSISNLKLEDQVNYRGHVWLDNFADSSTEDHLSKYGLGSDISKYTKLRSKFLIEIGANGPKAFRQKTLDNLQYEDTASHLSKTRRMTFKRMQAVLRFKGTMEKITLENGRRLAVISDTQSKEFTMVPWQNRYENTLSKQVGMQIDDSGKIIVRQMSKTVGR